MEHNEWHGGYEGDVVYGEIEHYGQENGKQNIDMHRSVQKDQEGGFLEHDNFFLQQLDTSMYEQASNDSSRGGKEGPPGLNGEHQFTIENMNFVLPEEVDFNAKSTAYPPSSAHVDITPNMGPMNLKNINREVGHAFVSPVLPGQNEKSYNNQHYYHKYGKRMNPDTITHQPGNLHIRPDAVFTPLVSPAVTPIESQVNLNNSQFNPPVQASFEPLTSPALNAQKCGRRRSSSSLYGPKEGSQSSSKRKTPHGTPVLQGSRNSKIRQAKVTLQFEGLPEASVEGSSGQHDVNFGRDKQSSMEATPATLMGFTMGILEQNKVQKGPENSDDRHKAGYQEKVLTRSSSSGEGSPIFRVQNSNVSPNPSLASPKSRSEKPATKKASHKLAEQGRRNRMNMAVKELSGLIPQSYHDKVAIPSKATTVELASEYIRDLIKKVGDDKKSNNNHNNTNENNNQKDGENH